MVSIKGKKVTHLEQFLSRKHYRLENFKRAVKTSSVDLLSETKNLVMSPSLVSYINMQKRLFNSSTWIGKSGMRLIWPKEKRSEEQSQFLKSERSQHILRAVKNKEKIPYSVATTQDIFKVIFNDRDFQRKNKYHTSQLDVPSDTPPIVLVSGILNEIFTTAAFERGARFLQKNYNVSYSICKTSGVKSVQQNVELIKNQIEEQYKKTNKKVWVIAFSKGGLDFLHFMRKYPELSQECIGGFSTIASPILGSNRINHKIFNLINNLHKLSHMKVYQRLDQKFDLLLKEFQKSISAEFQEGWFRDNFHYLPKNIFYSALAFETRWYDSHLWMILTKLFFQSPNPNDGIVDTNSALYPSYFDGNNLGILDGHHLISTRSSDYSQEALLEAHLIFRHYHQATKDRPLSSLEPFLKAL